MPEDEKIGGRRRAISADDTREILEDADEPVLATSQIAERLGVSRPTAGSRLKELKERGEVDYTEVGRSKAWYLVEVTEHRLSEYSDGTPPDSTDTTDSSDEPDEARTDGGETSLERLVDEGIKWGFAVGLGVAFAYLFVEKPAPEWYRPLAGASLGVLSACVPLRVLGIDRRLGALIDRAREIVDDDGGLFAFLKKSISEESIGPDDPQTPVERAARLDIFAIWAAILAGVFSLPLLIGVQLGDVSILFNTLTNWGAIALLAVPFVLITGGAILMWVSIFAAFALATVRRWGRDTQMAPRTQPPE